jgi:hypothetical protein
VKQHGQISYKIKSATSEASLCRALLSSSSLTEDRDNQGTVLRSGSCNEWRFAVVPRILRIHLGAGALLLAAGLVSTACGGQPDRAQEITLVPAAQLPVEIQRAPATVREAYQFAAANGAILKQVPCYCGCRAMGHTSAYSCYVSGGEAGQPARFDFHALGCAICVDTVQDAIRMTREGANPATIRSYIDRNYSKFGTSNMS